jgi:hypothetical protein
LPDSDSVLRPLNETQGVAEVTKEVVGIHVLPTRSLFGADIPRR